MPVLVRVPLVLATLALAARDDGGDDLTNVSIVCALEQFSIGGTISGPGEGTMTLENNGGDSIRSSGDGSFSFPNTISYGSTYAVTLTDTPPALACNVANGGSLQDNDIQNAGAVYLY